MVASSKIEKLAKGKYFKPEQTPFGALQPEQYQIVKDLLEKNGKLIGYVTGLGIYRRLGLTTQVSNVIQIGRNELRPPLERGKYKITFVKQKNTITKENVPLLQILDAFRYIKKVPDSSLNSSCLRLIEITRDMTENDKDGLMRLSQKYPPATRALLGAVLEMSQTKGWALIATLNPITNYKMAISKEVLPTKDNWNII